MSSERRDAVAIRLAGCLVGAAPVLWASAVWDGVPYGPMAWPLIAFLTLPPFMGAAALRSNREIGRIAAVAATIAVTAFAVYGQAAALNPHEESSLAPLGFFAGTVYGIAALAAIYGTERLVRAVHRHRRRAT